MLGVDFKQMARFYKGNRYYILLAGRDLFGDWEVRRVFGSRSTRYQRIITEIFSSYDECKKRYDKLVKYRINSRHYEMQQTGA